MAEDKLVHNLPPFRESAPFPPPNRSGEWVLAQGDLRELGQSLEVDPNAFADAGEPIRAIPDPWAQPRTFAEAVLDEHHSMHAASLSAWRGLLALFAFAHDLQTIYTLDVRPLVLGDAHIFDRVLSHLAPQVAIEGHKALWLTPGIVYFKPRDQGAFPLAMLNPVSLIALGRTSGRRALPTLPWMRNGLRDPLALNAEEMLTPVQLVMLRDYLRDLFESLRAETGAEAAQLRERIRDYQQACIDALAASGGSTMAARLGAAPKPGIDALYTALFATVLPPTIADPAAESQCRLRLREVFRDGPLKGVVLIDESIAARLGRGAGYVTAWGTISLRELLQSESRFEDVRQKAAADGYLLVRADDLFTGRAMRLLKKPLIEGHKAGLQDALLPLRPLALLLDGELGLAVSGDGDPARLSVTLAVQLEERSGGAAVSHALVRHFRRDAAAGEPLLLDEINWFYSDATVWPNIRSPAWPVYLARLFHQRGGSERVRPRLALSAEILREAIAGEIDGQQAVAVLRELNAGRLPAEDKDWFRRSEIATESYKDEIQSSNKGFEAIFYVDENDAAAGCVCLRLVKAEVSDRPTVAAVDFGTTNTVACLDDRTPIAFDNRLVHPIGFLTSDNARNQGHLYRWHFTDFMPPGQRRTPNPTVALSRRATHREARFWAFRNFIYFQPEGTYAEGGASIELEKFEAVINRAKFNLKWSDDPAHAAAASDFLTELMTMIAVEAAARGRDPRRIEWRFSVPDSMSSDQVENFGANLTRAVRTISPQGRLQPFYSEALAAGKYILSGREGARFVRGSTNLVLDIGGRTTDVTIWKGVEPIWKGSFQIAGQNFFTRFIVQNPDVLSDIDLADWAELLRAPPAGAATKGERPRIDAADRPYLAELLFSGPTLGEALEAKWPDEMMLKTGVQLRTTAAVFLAGIAYYLGLIVRALKLPPEDLTDPAFALCGRGARLFALMHGDQQPAGNSEVTRSLQLFSRAAGIAGTPRPRLFMEDEPKLEVVRGMLIDTSRIDAQLHERGDPAPSGPSEVLSAGLGIEFRAQPAIGIDTPISAALMAAPVKAIRTDGFDDFATALRELAGIGLDLHAADADGALAAMRSETEARMDEFRTIGPGRAILEPPFVTMLRELVTELAAPVAERDRKLTVTRAR